MTMQPVTAEALAAAVVAHESIRVRGGGTKSADADGVTIDLRGLTGILDYSPEECVLTARAGTPLLQIERELAAHGQYLPFDPPLSSRGATIGGTVAAGTSGPLRYRYGGVRDFLIGARVIDGEGRSIRSGGKVVKNAAGFLLHHAMVGSQGRFGVLSEVTFKVFPQPEARATVTASAGSVAAAASAARALESKRLDLEALDFDGDGTMWARIAGRADGLPARVARVIETIGGREITAAHEEQIWIDAREFAWASTATGLVRVPLSASTTSTPLAFIPNSGGSDDPAIRRVRYTCGGRLLWVATNDLRPIVTLLAAAGREGTIVRGPEAGARLGEATTSPFEERVRRVLDPRNRFRAASHSR